MHKRKLAIGLQFIGVLATAGGCGGDSPTAPTSPTSGPTAPTSLTVELSVAQRPGTRTGLFEAEPAAQTRQVVINGRVSAVGGPVDTLTGTLTVRVVDGSVLHDRDLDAIFAGTPTLNPGSDLIFEDVELDFDVPFPISGDEVGEATVEVTGRDASGQEVSASAMVDVSADETTPVTGNCQPDETTACALGDRFRVEVDWKDETSSGPGRVVANGRFFDGAEFYFFDSNNTDLLVQLLNRCTQNDHFWVFAAATTNVEVTVTVTDTDTGVSRSYFNPLGTAAQPITDSTAFATCP